MVVLYFSILIIVVFLPGMAEFFIAKYLFKYILFFFLTVKVTKLYVLQICSLLEIIQ